MIAAIGALSSPLSAGGIAGPSESASGLSGAAGLEGLGGAQGATSSAGASGPEGASGVVEATGGSGSFGETLTNAISSLEETQQSASGAAQALATGSVSDPESAIVTVEEAQLAMQLASQIRTKATEAAQQIFQTQV